MVSVAVEVARGLVVIWDSEDDGPHGFGKGAFLITVVPFQAISLKIPLSDASRGSRSAIRADRLFLSSIRFLSAWLVSFPRAKSEHRRKSQI